MDIENEKIEDISLDSLSNENLIESYKEVESFLKNVEEEIKKTDVGDNDE